jgi:hypothetical protein
MFGKLAMKFLPRKYKAALNAGMNLFSAVDTWDEVEVLSGWIGMRLSATGQFDIAEWGELGGKLHIIGAPKRKPKAAEPDVVVAPTT